MLSFEQLFDKLVDFVHSINNNSEFKNYLLDIFVWLAFSKLSKFQGFALKLFNSSYFIDSCLKELDLIAADLNSYISNSEFNNNSNFKNIIIPSMKINNSSILSLYLIL